MKKLRLRCKPNLVLERESKPSGRVYYKWTDEIDMYIKRHYATKGCDALALELNVPYRVLQSRALKKLKVSKFSHIDWTPKMLEFIKENYPKYGAPYTSEKLGLPITAVQKKASELKALYVPKDRYINADGYVVVGKSNSRELEHRVVMSKIVGRKLGYNDIVHHKDEDKGNNEPTNLELMTRKEHVTHHKPRLKKKASMI